ncbi:hypothetical protein QYE76_027452 [Lolium multiflorum]|uniref:Transposon protein, putative, CACTA, En/Spm sub-class n=1 Tax=Lolium multiflorum TaxID=4521 RepID=A0AAD8QME7_LOLMU|nr:hypothetical protein QYE76_027452 [Lolium multiflorum]
MMEDDDEEEEDDDMYPNYGDTATGHDIDEDEEAGGGDQDEEASDEPVDDDLRVHRDAETENEKRKLKGMLDDHKKKLYPNCEDGNTKLGATLELLQWKAEAGICDKPFEKLLKIMKRRFPKDNELPDSTYEAKKVLCPLGLEVLKIHACINDCILYRAEYENLEKCPVCTALRYKIRRDDPGDVEGEPPRKRVPAKVMCHELVQKGLLKTARAPFLLRSKAREEKKTPAGCPKRAPPPSAASASPRRLPRRRLLRPPAPPPPRPSPFAPAASSSPPGRRRPAPSARAARPAPSARRAPARPPGRSSQRKLLVNFIFPEPTDSDSENDRPDPEDPELNSVQRRVKKWALKKMAVQFNDYKKKLDSFFVKKGKTPDFKGPYEKIKDHWEEFVKLKKSDKAKKRSDTNTKNASNKMYFHTMGRGGYNGWQA